MMPCTQKTMIVWPSVNTVVCLAALVLSGCGTTSRPVEMPDRASTDDTTADVAAADAAAAVLGAANADAAVIDSVATPAEDPLDVIPDDVDTGPSDSDADGVFDTGDRCAESPDWQVVDDVGCALVDGVLETVEFETNGFALTEDATPELDVLAATLLQYPTAVISLGGHTDNRGRAVDNLELSKQRVMSVVRYLVASGIGAEQLRPFGYGESRPRAPNATPEGRSRNRRIEVFQIEP